MICPQTVDEVVNKLTFVYLFLSKLFISSSSEFSLSEFIVAWLFCTFPLLRPASLSAAWLFGHFLPPVPRTALWRVVFFIAYLLLRPASLFGAWLFGYFLPPAPRLALWRVAFFVISCSYTPPHSFIAWLFSLFLASAPRLALSPRGPFRHSLLLCPKYKFAPVMQQL